MVFRNGNEIASTSCRTGATSRVPRACRLALNSGVVAQSRASRNAVSGVTARRPGKISFSAIAMSRSPASAESRWTWGQVRVAQYSGRARSRPRDACAVAQLVAGDVGGEPPTLLIDDCAKWGPQFGSATRTDTIARNFRVWPAASCRASCWDLRSPQPTGCTRQYTPAAGRVP